MSITGNIWKPSLGATVLDSERVFFKVWAPEKDRVSVRLISGKSENEIDLFSDGHGYFTGVAEGAGPGALYLYVLDDHTYPDPASRSQPGGVHAPSEIIDPEAFHWEDDNWQGVPWRDYILYEIHVGAFTEEGTFEAIIPRLSYLKELGVTAIELMPVAQFSGNRNWGYDGVYPFAPQNSYGGPHGLKTLINACHKNGLAVVLDVVYNHFGPEGNYLGCCGPYFTDRYKTPWGVAINFDGPYSDGVRSFFIDNALYWVHEYHVDGLRLDAVHGIFDFSATRFLEELCTTVRRHSETLGREIYVIAESDLNDSRVIKPESAGGYGFHAQWNDDFHHALHAIVTGERTGYYQDFGKMEHLEKAFREGYVYSGQFSRHRKRRHGNSSIDRDADQFVVFSQNHDQVGNRQAGDRLSANQSFDTLKLIAGTAILSPFIPMIFMGEEYGETAPFLYFTSHSDPELAKAVSEGRKKEFASFDWNGGHRDPQDENSFLDSKLDFGLTTRGNNRLLHNFYRELIRLRREIPAFLNLSKKDIQTCFYEDEKALFVKRLSGNDEVICLYNFGAESLKIKLSLSGGRWKGILESSSVRWGGNSIEMHEMVFEGTGAEINVGPHSFVIYRMLYG